MCSKIWLVLLVMIIGVVTTQIPTSCHACSHSFSFTWGMHMTWKCFTCVAHRHGHDKRWPSYIILDHTHTWDFHFPRLHNKGRHLKNKIGGSLLEYKNLISIFNFYGPSKWFLTWFYFLNNFFLEYVFLLFFFFFF